MALTKVTKSGITDNSIDADKLEDGTIVAADIATGTITADKLNSTLDLSSKTVTLPNTSVSNAMLAGSIANAKLANSTLTINGSSVSLGGSVSAGSLDWQTVIVADGSTSTTGVAGRGYFINTTSAAHTFTLPISATRGDTIAIVDYAQNFATNKLTIARNGHNIQGVANNSLISTNRASITLVYVDATKGWVYQDESNVADLGEALFLTATGGTILTSGNFKTHVFTGDGSFAVSQLGNASGGPNNVDYLVVAGGGGSGVYGGGGGAGGYRTTFPSPGCNAGSFPVTSTTYPIAVGGGGISCQPPQDTGTAGSNSVFSTITSAGGGGGGGYEAPIGGSGGSGGGAGTCSVNTSKPGGSGNTPPVSPSQGNPGGPGTYNPRRSGGGGGGAGGSGSAGPGPGPAGPGGSGSPIATDFFGPTAPSYGTPGPAPGRYFAGGGGGYLQAISAPAAIPQGLGGAGGGGNGGNLSEPDKVSQSGTENTGGGSGGAAGESRTGGKGIVVIRYKFQ